MIETGSRVATSYTGSTTPEIATAIRSITPEQQPFCIVNSCCQYFFCQLPPLLHGLYALRIAMSISRIKTSKPGISLLADFPLQFQQETE